MHAARSEVVREIGQLGAPAFEHGLGHVVKRRERGHIVALPALCAQHTVLAHAVARAVEHHAHVVVTRRPALAHAVQHGKVQLVKRLRRLGRALARRAPHIAPRGFAHQCIRQQAVPHRVPNHRRQGGERRDRADQLQNERHEQRVIHAQHGRAQPGQERAHREPAASVIAEQPGHQRAQPVAAGEQRAVAYAQVHRRAERHAGRRARSRTAEVGCRQHEHERYDARRREQAEQAKVGQRKQHGRRQDQQSRRPPPVVLIARRGERRAVNPTRAEGQPLHRGKRQHIGCAQRRPDGQEHKGARCTRQRGYGGREPARGHHAQPRAYAHHAQHEQRRRHIYPAFQALPQQHDPADHAAERGQPRPARHQRRRHRQAEGGIPAEYRAARQHRADDKPLHASHQCVQMFLVPELRRPRRRASQQPRRSPPCLLLVHFRDASLVFPVYPK